MDDHGLAGGLRLISHDVPDTGLVALQVWLRAGSAEDGEDHLGVAHLMEHLVFRRSADRTRGSASERVAWLGGQINAMTAYDYTLFHVLVSTDALAEGIDVLARMLGQPPATEPEVAKERAIVLEEVRRSHDKPSNRTLQGLMRAAFERHPYGRPILGTPRSVAGLDASAAAAYRERWYRRGNLCVVAVGDLAGFALERSVTEAFAGIEAGVGPAAPRSAGVLPDPIGVSVEAGSGQETYFGVGWRRRDERHEDTVALEALSVLLTGGESFRLHRGLKRDRGLVSSVHASCMAMRDPGIIIISGTVGPTLDPHPSLVAVVQEVTRLAAEPIGEDELERARRVLRSRSIYRRETVQGWAQRIGLHTVMHQGPGYEARWREQLDALTPARVRDAAVRLLSDGPTALSVGYGVAHSPRSAASLRQLVHEACA